MLLQGVSGLLLSAAAGYWVYTQAEKEKPRVRKLGQLLGLAIIAVSVVGTGCKIYYLVTGNAPGKFFCPYTGKSAPPAQR